jgi:hypothetical protein
VYRLQEAAKDLEYKASKIKAEAASASTGSSVMADVAAAWGLSLPRPPPRASKGGPKPKSEKWKQGLYDYLDEIVAGSLPLPVQPPPLEYNLTDD